MFQFGPYGPNHATAGTFAFKKELLQITRYEDDAKLAEEKQFLKILIFYVLSLLSALIPTQEHFNITNMILVKHYKKSNI